MYLYYNNINILYKLKDFFRINSFIIYLNSILYSLIIIPGNINCGITIRLYIRLYIYYFLFYG